MLIYHMQEDKGTACNLTYMNNILKKVITAAESTHAVVMEGLYERLAYYLTSHVVNSQTAFFLLVPFRYSHIISPIKLLFCNKSFDKVAKCS